VLARIKNENLEIGLPTSGVLRDGRTVSGYELLPLDELAQEGWKEAIENHMLLLENQYEEIESYFDNGTNIIITYLVKTCL